jgi:hypothetical protein
MTIYTPATPPSGWYPDPAGSPQLRWWDGSAWTAQLAPLPSPSPVPPQAAPELQPYIPMQRGNREYQTTAWGDEDALAGVPTRWNTGAAYGLAVAPVISLAFLALAFWIGAAVFSWLTLLLVLLNLALMIVFAVRDHTRLTEYGYVFRANPWLVLLIPPLLYLIVRTVRVHREVGRGGAPLWTYLATSVAVGMLTVVGAVALIPLIVAQHDRAESAVVSAQLQNELINQGISATVSCPPSISPALGTDFTCTALDSSQVSHSIGLRISTGPDGKPALVIVSVAPVFTR